MAGRTYGYARVSTRDQNLDRQLDALGAFGVDEVFADKASGKDFDRPEWARLRATLGAGDVLVVKSIDRLGRDYDEIIDQWRDITKRGGSGRGGAGHATFGHAAGTGRHHGNVHRGHRAAAALLRGAGGARGHKAAAGRGDRGREGRAACASGGRGRNGPRTTRRPGEVSSADISRGRRPRDALGCRRARSTGGYAMITAKPELIRKIAAAKSLFLTYSKRTRFRLVYILSAQGN